MKKDTPALLKVDDLNIHFKTDNSVLHVVKGISFELGRKETLGIVGESGSGKSVTALSILQLIKTPPLSSISGQILLNGENILSYSQKQMQSVRGKKIGYIFQEPMSALNPVLTIGKQIEEMIVWHEGASKKEAWEKGILLLGQVGIPNPEWRMKSYPHELSGGMRQRAMIAMAISLKPNILIADEPTTALDVTVQAQILDLFNELKRSHEMAIIFITHDLKVISEIADNVLVVKSGEVMEYEDVFTLFKSPKNPYTIELFNLIRKEKVS